MIYDTLDKEERDSRVLAERMEALYVAAKKGKGWGRAQRAMGEVNRESVV